MKPTLLDKLSKACTGPTYSGVTCSGTEPPSVSASDTTAR